MTMVIDGLKEWQMILVNNILKDSFKFKKMKEKKIIYPFSFITNIIWLSNNKKRSL
jgi:hypothetical protein